MALINCSINCEEESVMNFHIVLLRESMFEKFVLNNSLKRLLV